MDDLREYSKSRYYVDNADITEKLLELADFQDDEQISEELTEALYWLDGAAQNPYNADYFRVLYNMLARITDFE